MITNDNRNRTHPLPTDSYYRGYRFSFWRPGTEEAKVHIYSGPELLTTTSTAEQARKVVDDWLNAR